MRLKRLDVQGFKSFAVRQDFGFERGLTGIVGPNGCGKSNVVDAIKWVLGETRPTSLRGSEMQDVIFKGTASRTPLGYAEVTLVLDNQEQLVPGPAEVSLTRRLFRTGEGEYELNKQDVRRKDLKHLLYGTGLGVNAYSILEQGKIDAVLSANAIDRRAIFEEAAGITRFRSDRKEAIRRLESTEKDLESVRAVLAELERQRNSLRVQASRARRFAELADQLRGWRTALALYRFLERSVEKQSAEAEVARLQAMENGARQARSRSEEEAAAAREESKNLAAEQTRLASELANLQSEEGRRSERARSAREQGEALLQAARAKTQRSVELAALHDDLLKQLESVVGELSHAAARLRDAETDFDAKTTVSRERSEAYRACGRDLEEAQRQLLSAIESRTTVQNALADLDAEDRATRNEDERLQRRTADIRQELERLSPALVEAEKRHTAAAAAFSKLREEETSLQDALQDTQSRTAQAEQSLNEVEKRFSALQSRLHVLRELEHSHAGIGAAAKAAIDAKLDGIVAHIADVVQTDVAHALALEASLGRYADGVVATSRAAAIECLRFVRERKLGRLAVIVADPSLEAAPSGSDIKIPQGEGILGMLADFVRGEAATLPVLRRYLARTVLVESIADGEKWVAAYPEFTFVTLAGERVDRLGATGGSREATATPIARKSAISALEIDENALSIERDSLLRLRDAARAELVSVRQRQQEWKLQFDRVSREASESRIAHSEVALRHSRLASERQVLEAEAIEVAARRRNIASKRVDLIVQVDEAVVRVKNASASVHDLQVHRLEQERLRDEALAAESSARVEVARLRGEIDRLETESARRKDSAERTRVESSNLQREAEQDRARSEQFNADADALESSIAQLAEQRATLVLRVEEVKRRGAAQAEAAEEAMRRERERTAVLEEVQAQLGSARLAEQRASMQCEEIVERAREEAHVSIPDLAGILQLTGDFVAEQAEQKVEDLRARLERLGSVSSDATVELDSIESRYADLDRQRTDLETGKRTLQETISELDTQCGVRFREAFESIRKHFGDLFRRLFRGGKADIVLQEGVDPLEAGVDILAQPPGKKLQSISLLSGGERTLTALALLFAAFKTKPSPFCVLDEVDAALDDANVERFLGMLDEFKESTQFIVVTHHRRTMGACSALLGVTMSEQGVSQKVAVKLDDVDRIVPGAIGTVGTPRESRPSAAVPDARPSNVAWAEGAAG